MYGTKHGRAQLANGAQLPQVREFLVVDGEVEKEKPTRSGGNARIESPFKVNDGLRLDDGECGRAREYGALRRTGVAELDGAFRVERKIGPGGDAQRFETDTFTSSMLVPPRVLA